MLYAYQFVEISRRWCWRRLIEIAPHPVSPTLDSRKCLHSSAVHYRAWPSTRDYHACPTFWWHDDSNDAKDSDIEISPWSDSSSW